MLRFGCGFCGECVCAMNRVSRGGPGAQVSGTDPFKVQLGMFLQALDRVATTLG